MESAKSVETFRRREGQWRGHWRGQWRGNLYACAMTVLLLVSLYKIKVNPAHATSARESDLYFYIHESQERCFVEELATGTVAVVSYKKGTGVKKDVKPLQLNVYDPRDKLVQSHELNVEDKYGDENEYGRVAYLAASHGEHNFCFIGDPQRPWPASDKTIKFHLKIELVDSESGKASTTGFDSGGFASPSSSDDKSNLKFSKASKSGSDYSSQTSASASTFGQMEADAARTEHVISLAAELKKLDASVDFILKELRLIKSQEDHFNAQSTEMSTKIMYWSVLQSLVLLVSGVWQLFHLRQYFRNKKLV